MIQGCASPSGTLNFSKKNKDVKLQNFRKVQNLTLSNVGIGTYLGNPDDQTDQLVINAIKKSILSGINVIDTAINYKIV